MSHPRKAEPAYRLDRLISGGPTGIDQLGLEVARLPGIPTGGIVPKGYLTENGPDERLRGYGLTDHTSAQYSSRTRARVRQSGGTVIFGTVRYKTDPRYVHPGRQALLSKFNS